MKTLRFFLFVLCLLPPARGDDQFERIRDISPNKKLAMRVVCGSRPDDPENIDSAIIQSITLISLPDKKTALQLLPAEDVGSTFQGLKLVWSPDSKWCAFYYAAPRVGYTHVFRLAGGKFVPTVKPEDLRVNLPKEGEVRDEFISPMKWIKPGELLLEQDSIFRASDNEPSDSTWEFTALFHPSGKSYKITSKRQVTTPPPSD